MFVLRPLRWYGMATCLRQGWTTRVNGVEVSMRGERKRLAAPELERTSA
jgi:hypothetical protein